MTKVISHHIDLGDPQKDPNLAACSCGWKHRDADKRVLRLWCGLHLLSVMFESI